jgi:hypothetical protein
MTPKEKAKELYNKYCNMESHCDDAKECSLVAVDEILLYLKNSDDVMTSIKAVDYWQEVKTEIEKL